MCLLAWSCPTLCNPMDWSPPGSSIHKLFQTRKLEWVAIFSSRVSFWPRDWICVSCISCIGRQILYHWVIWEVQIIVSCYETESLLKNNILKLNNIFKRKNICIYSTYRQLTNLMNWSSVKWSEGSCFLAPPQKIRTKMSPSLGSRVERKMEAH